MRLFACTCVIMSFHVNVLVQFWVLAIKYWQQCVRVPLMHSVLQISGIASHFAPQIQANVMQQHFRIALIAMQNKAWIIALSSANLPFDIWKRSKAGLQRIKITSGSRRHSPTTRVYSIATPLVTVECGLLVAAGCAVWSGALATQCLQTNERTMAIDGEADSAPSAAIEQSSQVK